MSAAKCVIITFAVINIALVAAAQTTMENRAFVGDQSGVVSQFERTGVNYAALSDKDHYRVCNAYLLIQQFDPFFDCFEKLKRRIAAQGGYLADPQHISQIRNVAWASVSLLSLEAAAYLELGDFKRASERADQGLGVIETKRLAWKSTEGEFKQAFGNLASFGLLGKQEEGIKIIESLPLLGIKGLAAARQHEPDEARKYASRLAVAKTDGYTTSGYEGQRRLWLARITFEMGDFEAAYQALLADQKLSGGGLLAKAITGINQINPALYIVLPLYTGTFNLDDLKFAYDFEPRFMLHRSELETGRYAAARRGFDKILAEPKMAGYGRLHYGALHGRGLASLAQGETGPAIADFKKSVDIIEAQRGSIGTDAYKIGFVGDKQKVYSDLVSALIGVGRLDEAFEYAERAKSRALVDLLANKKDFKGGGLDTARLTALLDKLDDTERKATPKQNRKQLAGLRGVSVNLRREIKSESRAVSSLVSVQAPAVSELQAHLPEGEVLIEYYGFGSRMFAFTLSAKGIKATEIAADGLDVLVRQFRRSLTTLTNDSFRVHGRALYERLIAPFEAEISGQRVTIVPHGALHYLPFSVLIASDGRFLIDKVAIRVLPSASVMTLLKNRKSGQPGNLLAFGNPDLRDNSLDLPGAELEVNAIVRGRSASTALLRDQATESAVKAIGGGFRYLHFASHAQFNESKPMESAVLLAADDENDGRLTVSELFDLTLDADLVTLSACETALGEVSNGDDVIGFTRGFLYAGVSSIVSTLWQVDDDATNKLMQAFYRNLDAGQDKRTALRGAQLAVAKKYNSHPYYWAAFQLTGAL